MTTMVSFPAEAPLVRRTGVDDAGRAAMMERHVFPDIAASIAEMLDIEVAFIPDTLVGAPWNPTAFVQWSTWAVAQMSFHVDEDQVVYNASLMVPLEMALDWGAIGIQLPQANRPAPVVMRDGTVALGESGEPGFQAFKEVCNVVACGALARVWRTELGRPFHITLDDVLPVTASLFGGSATDNGFIALQGTLGYSEHRLPPARGGARQYERLCPVLMVLPADRSVELLWPADGISPEEAHQRLLLSGDWRWAKR